MNQVPAIGDTVELVHAKGNPDGLDEGHRGVVGDVEQVDILLPGGNTEPELKVFVDWEVDVTYTLFDSIDRWQIVEKNSSDS